jgi:hypothetical protein
MGDSFHTRPDAVQKLASALQNAVQSTPDQTISGAGTGGAVEVPG